MWFCKKPNDDSKLLEQIAALKADNDRLRAQKSDEESQDINSSTFSIHWKNIDAFSVERMGSGSGAYTIIGYWAPSKDGKCVAEWKFYCSHEQHERLSQEFRASFSTK